MMMTIRKTISMAVAFALLGAPTMLAGQRGPTRLSPAVTAELGIIFRDAEADHLPIASLRGKMDEGMSKGATEQRILDVVRGYAAALRTARTALATSDSVDLEAGAAALRAGATPAILASIRGQRQGAHTATSLVMYVDLVTRGIPAPTAGSGLIDLLQGGASDAELRALQGTLAQQSARGDDPLTVFRTLIQARPARVASPRPGQLTGGGN